MEQKQVAIMSLYQGEGKTATVRHLAQTFATRRVETFVADWAQDGRAMELEARHPHAFSIANGQSFVDDEIQTNAALVFVDIEGNPPANKAKAVAGVDMVIVPTNLTDKSRKGMTQTLRWLESHGVPRERTFVLFNNINPNDNQTVRAARRELGYWDVNVLDTPVRRCDSLAALEADGLLASDATDPNSEALSSDYQLLANEVWSIVNGA